MTEERKKRSVLFWVLLAGGGCLVLVACTGILAAFAIPSFVSYTQRSKAAEAPANLQSLAYAVESHCELTGSLPGAAGPVPPTPPGSEKVLADFQSDRVFAELGFTPMDPVYYSYGIRPDMTGGVQLYARGDLDGDGDVGEQTWTCTPVGCACSEDLVLPEDKLE